MDPCAGAGGRCDLNVGRCAESKDDRATIRDTAITEDVDVSPEVFIGVDGQGP